METLNGTRVTGKAVLAVLFATAVQAADLYWYQYAIDTTGDIVGHSSIKVGPDDSYQVAFRGPKYDVRLAELIDGVWKTTSVDTGLGSDAKIDLALDEDGNPNIIYHDWAYSKVNFARRQDGEWERTLLGKINLANVDFYQISLVVDGEGTAHVAYASSHTGDKEGHAALTYNSVNADGEVGEPVILGTRSQGGKWNSTLLGTDGKVFISSHEFNGAEHSLHWLEDEEWIRALIDSNGNETQQGYGTRLAYAGEGKFWVAHQDRTRRKLQVGFGDAEGWDFEDLDTLPGWSSYGSANPVGVDKDGNPYVVYAKLKAENEKAAECELNLAHRDGDGEWTITQLAEGNIGEFVSMAMNSEGLPALSFFDRSEKVLRVWIGSATEPPDEDENGIPDYQEISSIHPRQRVLPQGALGPVVPVRADGRKMSTGAAQRIKDVLPSPAR